LYSKYYADFPSFKAAISTLIDTADLNQKERLKSLMSWKFQSFTKVQFLSE